MSEQRSCSLLSLLSHHRSHRQTTGATNIVIPKDVQLPEERAVLVGAPTKDIPADIADEHLSELAELADTAGARVVERVKQKLDRLKNSLESAGASVVAPIARFPTNLNAPPSSSTAVFLFATPARRFVSDCGGTSRASSHTVYASCCVWLVTMSKNWSSFRDQSVRERLIVWMAARRFA
jgi:hypothetical protein